MTSLTEFLKIKDVSWKSKYRQRDREKNNSGHEEIETVTGSWTVRNNQRFDLKYISDAWLVRNFIYSFEGNIKIEM